MAGGIQKGTEAGSKESKELDNDTRIVSRAIANYLRAKGNGKYYFEKGHTNYNKPKDSEEKKYRAAIPELREMGITVGCVPDGGMWFDGPRSQPRLLKAVFEAKKQQDGGNAVERWCKNYMLCKGMNPAMKYVTLMIGPGAVPNGTLYKFGHSMSAANGENCIFYYEPNGFSREGIFNIMISILELDITWDQVQPYLDKEVKNNFAELFISAATAEAQAKRRADAEERARLEQEFRQFAQNPADPLYPVWHRLPKENKNEAHTIVLDMLQEGKANAVIATELVECFLK